MKIPQKKTLHNTNVGRFYGIYVRHTDLPSHRSDTTLRGVEDLFAGAPWTHFIWNTTQSPGWATQRTCVVYIVSCIGRYYIILHQNIFFACSFSNTLLPINNIVSTQMLQIKYPKECCGAPTINVHDNIHILVVDIIGKSRMHPRLYYSRPRTWPWRVSPNQRSR